MCAALLVGEGTLLWMRNRVELRFGGLETDGGACSETSMGRVYVMR